MAKEIVQIFSARMNAGMTNSGMKYDYTRLGILTDVFDPNGKARGKTVTEYQFGDSNNFTKSGLDRVVLPCEAEVEFQSFAKPNGDRETMIVAVTIKLQPKQ